MATATPALEFDEEAHVYRLNGRKIPGVTETISRIAPHREVSEWYLQRGSAVHAAVALALQGSLDWESVDERIQGRVRAVLAFIKDCGITPVFYERRLVSGQYQFAGTLDFFGVYGGENIIVDWKGSLSPQASLQLGAYYILATEEGHKVNRAVAVETHDDATYKCKWMDSPSLRIGSRTFLSFLTSANWLEKNNFKK